MPSNNESKKIDPEVKEAGLRILEKAIGKFGANNETVEQLSENIKIEIVKQRPYLNDNPEAVRNALRFLSVNFFEIVSDEKKTPSGKKYNQIIDKFTAESVKKYLEENKNNIGD
jgi:transcription antitermination factor NusA-like protein